MSLSIRKLALSIAAIAAVGAASPALAEGGSLHPRSGGFSFDGPFGTFDQAQLQRGYKVYREVCAACHSMDLLYFRTLGEKGGPFYDPHAENPAQNRFVRALAAEIEVADIDTETGEAIRRPATSTRWRRCLRARCCRATPLRRPVCGCRRPSTTTPIWRAT